MGEAKRVLVAGCGYVGTALAEQLAAAGHEVWGLRRSPQEPSGGVTFIAADLSRPETLEALPEGLDLVAYTTAADERSEAAYREAYVEGPRNLLAALKAQGQAVQRVAFTSSTGVYGQNQGEWVDESSPTEPTSFTGRILLEGEQVFLEQSPFPAIVLRLSGIYGPGRTRLIDRVRSGEVRRLEEPRYTNRIHRDDCAGALRHLLLLSEPKSLYIGVDEEPADLSDVYDWLSQELGQGPVPVQDPPEGPVRTGKRCRGQRLRESGYRFAYSTFREGYREMLGER